MAFKSSLSNYPCTYRLRPKKSKRILQPAEHASKPTWKVVLIYIRIFVVFVTTLQSHFYNHIKVNSSGSSWMVTSWEISQNVGLLTHAFIVGFDIIPKHQSITAWTRAETSKRVARAASQLIHPGKIILKLNFQVFMFNPRHILLRMVLV